jgi:hypothetical protein
MIGFHGANVPSVVPAIYFAKLLWIRKTETFQNAVILTVSSATSGLPR